MMIGGIINERIKSGLSNTDAALKKADVLASDAIINYKTVVSLNA
jgi:hypothetical protein